MADMEVLEAKEKVAKEKADPEVKKAKKTEFTEDAEYVKETSDGASKSGKIKRRGKKSNFGDEVKDDQRGESTTRTNSREAMDTAIVKRMVGQLMKDCETTNMKVDDDCGCDGGATDELWW